MNETRKDCFTSAVDIVYLSDRRLIILAIVDLVLLTVNVVANALVIYVLIKTEQLVCTSCKFILQLSSTDILIALLTQTLFIAVLFETKCSVKITSQFVSTFTSRVSGYTIALIGFDRFVRIKYGVNYTLFLTNKFVTMLLFLPWLAGLIHAGMITIGLLIHQEEIVRTIGVTFDASVFLFVLILQVATIKSIGKMNSQVRPESLRALQEADKKITRLCSRIMFLLVLFIIPFLVVNVVRNKIRDQLNPKNKALLEFIFRFSMIFAYSNSIANAMLFLSTNSMGKRFLTRRLGLDVEGKRKNVRVNENQNIPH